MQLNPIALAIPFFFLLIGGELWLARARHQRGLYRFHDAVTDLSCGITSQITLIFMGAFLLAGYAWVYDHYRIVTFRSSLWPWLIASIGVDFLYYWWHRASHEVNVLWAAHIVHHQSEDYNLAVALRQAVLTHLTTLPFYLPLAFLGVPPIIYATSVAISTLYQFWIHTQLVGKIRGPVDLILNLPSHHRVHHAINPRYLDKNYGAVLIVWDRLFGTHEEEVEAPVYGITKQLGSFNPVWAQVHYWVELAQLSWRAPRFADKLRVWWKSPAWAPEGLPKPSRQEVTPERFHKFGSDVTPRVKLYVGLHFVAVSVATFCLLWWQEVLPLPMLAAGGGLVLIALSSFGALLEGRRWGLPVEVARLALAAATALWLTRVW